MDELLVLPLESDRVVGRDECSILTFDKMILLVQLEEPIHSRTDVSI